MSHDVGGGAAPETPSLEALLVEEARLILPSFNEDDAVDLGNMLVQVARERRLAITIEVTHGPRIAFRAALNGTTSDNDAYIAGKRRIVQRFGHSSLYIRLKFEGSGRTFEESTGLRRPRFGPFGGGFPLVVEATGLVGVVTVSGLPQIDDHALVVSCLERFLEQRMASRLEPEAD